MATQRNFRKYVLKKKRRIVYAGVTDDPERREQEHRQSGKDFDKMVIEGRAVTKESALEWEKDRIAKYQRGHGGEAPKYNTNTPS
jgi:predicted GIY-YIG superfamily endonuclease